MYRNLFCDKIVDGREVSNMTKTEFIREVAKREDMPQQVAAKILNTIIGVITEELKEGNAVKIQQFGTFSVTKQKGRTFKNPKTKKIQTVSDSRKPLFRPGQTLRKAVNEDEG